jgi:hypothetical protein
LALRCQPKGWRYNLRQQPSALATNLDFAAPLAFSAESAAPARRAENIAAIAAGKVDTCGSAGSAARGTISIAWGFTINADMTGHERLLLAGILLAFRARVK